MEKYSLDNSTKRPVTFGMQLPRWKITMGRWSWVPMLPLVLLAWWLGWVASTVRVPFSTYLEDSVMYLGFHALCVAGCAVFSGMLGWTAGAARAVQKTNQRVSGLGSHAWLWLVVVAVLLTAGCAANFVLEEQWTHLRRALLLLMLLAGYLLGRSRALWRMRDQEIIIDEENNLPVATGHFAWLWVMLVQIAAGLYFFGVFCSNLMLDKGQPYVAAFLIGLGVQTLLATAVGWCRGRYLRQQKGSRGGRTTLLVWPVLLILTVIVLAAMGAELSVFTPHYVIWEILLAICTVTLGALAAWLGSIRGRSEEKLAPTEEFDFRICGDYCMLTACRSKAKEVVVPSTHYGLPVCAIGRGAFAGRNKLLQVTLPDSLTEIGPSAFAHCRGLKTLDIPGSVVVIGEDAFEGCSAILRVERGSAAEDYAAATNINYVYR